MPRRLLIAATALSFAAASVALGDTLRVATFDVELQRRGPGLLLSDILSGEDQVVAVVRVVAAVAPDVLLLTGFDHDHEGHALAAFADRLGAAGHVMPHVFAARPNAGLPSGLDLDGNGRLGEARDAQGYGAFTGQGGMAVLSRYPIGDVRDFSAFPWADLPGAIPPTVDGRPFPSPEVQAAQRLSSVAHWDVPVITPDGPLHLLAFNATTPVFDGPEDLNGRRNHDEILFWKRLLDGALPFDPPAEPVVVLGNANLDPVDGDGRREAIRALLDDPRLQDARPASSGGTLAANPEHRADPALDTADWSDPRPGNLRVDYVLPDARLEVSGAGVFWPASDDPLAEVVETASRHRLVWVDLEFN